MRAKIALSLILAEKTTNNLKYISAKLDINPFLYFTRNMHMSVLRISIITAAFTGLMLGQNAYGCCTELEAREALAEGNFDLAASAAPQLGTAEARLIAAEALSAKVLLGIAGNSKKAAKEALALSKSVLLEQPDNKEAQFQHALADGFITRAASPFSAYRKKLPQKTKMTVDALIASAPNDGRGHALLGAWHMGILRKTGAKNGKKWFGADFGQGQAAYEKALTLRPDDIIITGNYALSFAEYDFDRNEPRARDMLIGVLASAPKDAVERAVQARISEILTLWDDDDAALKRMAQFLDGDG